MPPRRVAIFGLSANPPTGAGGHADIVRSIAHSGRFNEVWAVPVYRHPYTTATKSRLEDSYEHRVHMCELGLADEGTSVCPVVVSRIEQEYFTFLAKQPVAPLRSGTIDIIEFLMTKHGTKAVPRNASPAGGDDALRNSSSSIEFHLVLGSDAYSDLLAGKWKQSERLLSIVTVWVIERASGDITTASSSSSNSSSSKNIIPWIGRDESLSSTSSSSQAYILKGSASTICGGSSSSDGSIAVSSTLVRSLRAQPYWPLSSQDHPLLGKLIHPNVLAYIKSRGLYMYSPEALGRARRNNAFMVLSVAVVFAGGLWTSGTTNQSS